MSVTDHTCLEERFGLTFEPNQDLDVILVVVRIPLIWGYIYMVRLREAILSKKKKLRSNSQDSTSKTPWPQWNQKLLSQIFWKYLQINPFLYESLLVSKVDPNLSSRHVCVCARDEGSLKAICTYVIIKLSVVKHVFSYR